MQFSEDIRKLQTLNRKREKGAHRNVSIIEDEEGRKIVLINDKLFKGLDKKDWKNIELYLARYVGECYEMLYRVYKKAQVK